VAFEVFDRRLALAERKPPTLTITRSGTIGISASSYAALGFPRSVELLFDQGERLIGLRPSVEAYAYAVLGTKSHFVAAQRLVRHMSIPHETPLRLAAEMRGDVLVVDLKFT
jgi:hypothetical protein